MISISNFGRCIDIKSCCVWYTTDTSILPCPLRDAFFVPPALLGDPLLELSLGAKGPPILCHRCSMCRPHPSLTEGSPQNLRRRPRRRWIRIAIAGPFGADTLSKLSSSMTDPRTIYNLGSGEPRYLYFHVIILYSRFISGLSMKLANAWRHPTYWNIDSPMISWGLPASALRLNRTRRPTPKPRCFWQSLDHRPVDMSRHAPLTNAVIGVSL